MKAPWKTRVAPLLLAIAVIATLAVGGSVAAQAAGVSVTGKLNPDQKAKKCQQDNSLNRREKVVCIATSQLGVRETGQYKRKSTNCQKYFRDFGSSLNCNDDNNGQWCAAFTRWVWAKAGVPGTPKSFYVPTWADQLGRKVATPKPGDVAVAKSQMHIEIVVRVTRSGNGTVTVHTIDGNGGRDNVARGSHRRGAMNYYRMPS
jgi:hypothetical protein